MVVKINIIETFLKYFKKLYPAMTMHLMNNSIGTVTMILFLLFLNSFPLLDI